MNLKHFLKRQNRSKNKIRKITVKSRNDVKSACFWHVLCHISAIFEDIDLKFCTHIHKTLLSNICYGFLNFLIWGETVLKRKKNWTFFGNFSKFSKFWKSEIAVSYKSIDRSPKTAPVAAIPVNPFRWSKSANHDVTLTSLTADLFWPGSYFFYTRCGIVARRGMASFKAKFPVLQELFAKNHRGGPLPPPQRGEG